MIVFFSWKATLKIDSSVKRVFVRSFVMAVFFSFTLVPQMLSPYEVYMPLLAPTFFTLIVHMVKFPETITEFSYWYLYSLIICLIVYFVFGIIISAIIKENKLVNKQVKELQDAKPKKEKKKTRKEMTLNEIITELNSNDLHNK